MQDEKQTYQKEYQKQYLEKNKRVSFILSNVFFEELRKRAVISDISVNTFSKNIITNHLNNSNFKPLNKEQEKHIKDYIRISRGIATNINQIAYKTNIDEVIDINILIKSLQSYEEEFKKFIQKI